MNARRRGVLVRIIIAIGIFAYAGYYGSQVLPAFDILVMVAFFLLYLLWTTVAEGLIYQDPDEFVIEDDDRKSYLYIQLAFMVALFYAALDFVGLHYTRIKSLEPAIIYGGFALFIVSCLVRWWGFRSLGKWFNPRVAVYQNHKLVTDGAYRKIRHPLYLGSLLSFVAIPMVFNSWGSLLLMIITTIPALIHRIKTEEELMSKHFGPAYGEYVERSKKLIPGIW
jgi:protein-S-isoprenylcysteine O-methyltransferase Ste14